MTIEAFANNATAILDGDLLDSDPNPSSINVIDGSAFPQFPAGRFRFRINDEIFWGEMAESSSTQIVNIGRGAEAVIGTGSGSLGNHYDGDTVTHIVTQGALTEIAFTVEKAQDATFGSLSGDACIWFTYDDGANTGTLELMFDDESSLTYGSGGLLLDGDDAAPGNNKVYGTDGSGTKGWQDLTESAQDAVGGILTDTDTINFTYDDGTPTITADVRTQASITSDSSGIKLVGDADTPGINKMYTTDSGGAKCWQDQLSFTESTLDGMLDDSYSIDYTWSNPGPFSFHVRCSDVGSIEINTGSGDEGIQLDGDVASPGNFYHYGTDGSGNKGWLNLNATDSINWSSGTLNLVGDSSSPGNTKFYGTDGSGTKGWYGLPSGGSVGSVPGMNVADSEINGLSFSNPPTDTELNALRSQCEDLRDDVAALHQVVTDMRAALYANGLIS